MTFTTKHTKRTSEYTKRTMIVPSELMNQFDFICDHEGMKVSGLFERVLADYIRRHKRNNPDLWQIYQK